ncbi:MAG TPA: ABC transporter permease subunit [Rhodocyclaceae bacterium]|nr:ABC transporter permease subunit [Rhodocyclaceae bacterium]
MSAKWLARSWMAAVYAFLYLPILSLVVFSFNESPLVTVWSGFSLKWYDALANDEELIAGLLLSLKVALLCGLCSVLLGTLAAFALVRYPRFFSRALFNSLVNAPLVMPEVIIGLSLLLFLVSVQGWLGFPQRGLATILLGHTLLGTAFATVVVMSRLKEMDHSLEEAAADLGARPLQVFVLITLPLIAPALVSAFLLAFTLSFDDVVISSFLSGPGATTMPIVIFSRAKLGLNPTVNAVAAVTIGLVSLLVIALSLYQLAAQRRRRREIALAGAESMKHSTFTSFDTPRNP